MTLVHKLFDTPLYIGNLFDILLNCKAIYHIGHILGIMLYENCLLFGDDQSV